MEYVLAATWDAWYASWVALALLGDRSMKVSLLRPTDQPTGRLRLINELRDALTSEDLDDLRIVVAFAKLGPLLRLSDAVARWRSEGKTVRAIFGIDQGGTTRQAVEYALARFDEVYLAHAPAGPFRPTFHPKLYIFSGPDRALGYIGSNNLSLGGTELNFETCIRLEMERPEDDETVGEVLSCWDDALRSAARLTPSLLSGLISAGRLPDEGRSRAAKPSGGLGNAQQPLPPGVTFPLLKLVLPSPIPQASLKYRPKGATQPKPGRKAPGPSPPSTAPSLGARALVIQIIPHRNGEVFLSKRALDQDPAFFGWPFTGRTVPKKASNPSYPQRDPDPVVSLTVHDAHGRESVSHYGLNLNTVYYTTKCEIRITVPPDVVRSTPEYSVLVMRQAEGAHDYDFDIYAPGSAQYETFLGICNQTMPSGGKPVARKFGWI